MSPNTRVQLKQCFECRFEAAADDGTWKKTTHPSLGSIMQCPECGSTNVWSVD